MAAEQSSLLGEVFARKLEEASQRGEFPASTTPIDDIDEATLKYGPVLAKAMKEAREEVGLPPLDIGDRTNP